MSLRDSQVGLYSYFHDNAIWRHGYNHPNSISMAYMYVPYFLRFVHPFYDLQAGILFSTPEKLASASRTTCSWNIRKRSVTKAPKQITGLDLPATLYSLSFSKPC
jgi:hypothetical protein